MHWRRRSRRKPDALQALKLSAYAFTAAWVAGFAQIVPWLGALIALAGGLYSIYLFYLGLPVLMKCPPSQTTSYAVTCIVAAVVLNIVVAGLVGAITHPGDPGHIRRSDIDFSNGSPLGTLNDRANKIEDAQQPGAQPREPHDGD